ncbi:MAG: hypothetical protein CVV64_09820 [Candidatus Wallbacteria bacterium HGW-Wallbacteria-1]|jgi:hypothetical protein|uniref:Peptidase M28 domain-containing protein n=1 Tax=Candidatus Wallbacteria bacterium HGW-Wallbacteria-1 TaxID=2013854 RepID=A0A2N1PPJ9_9BACT|nr:MAG: hypothetical protein CVV64_09820 [Candidatus Wallbacteria bacterium HGW-Wallbacteria-1]
MRNSYPVFRKATKVALSLFAAASMMISVPAVSSDQDAPRVRFGCPSQTVVTIDISSLSDQKVESLKNGDGVQAWAQACGKLILRVSGDSAPGVVALDSVDAVDADRLSEPMLALTRGGGSPIDDLRAHVTILARGEGFVIFQATEAVLEYLMGKQSNHFMVEPFSGEAPLRIESDRFLRSIERRAPATLAPAVAPIKPDTKRIDTNIRKLEGFKTRYTYVQGYVDSARWAVEKFREMGYTAELVSYDDYGKEQFNVVAQAPDADNAGFYLVGAHLDSTSEQPRTLAPGADDNASGSAGVLELAALLKGRPEARKIRFLLFAGEEAGLKGSTAYAAQLKASGESSKCSGVVILDMIGFDRSGGLSSMVETKPEHKAFIAPFVEKAESLDLAVKVSLRPWGSDHVPFLRLGIPTFLIIEDEFEANHNYHRTTDTADEINLKLSAAILRTVVEGLVQAIGK